MNTPEKSRPVQYLIGGANPLSTSLAADVLPKAKVPNSGVCSNTGVSTCCMHNQSIFKHSSSNVEKKSWYALRTTYGREKKAYEYIIAHGGTAFYPTIIAKRIVEGKKTFVESSRLPNIFFAYGTLEELKEFVYDNYHEETKPLRFYYNVHHNGTEEPMIVPERQMDSLKIICDSGEKDIILLDKNIDKFRNGQRVIVEEGPFAGVEGVVARFCGQQRVGVNIEGAFTIITTYIPKAFLKIVE